MAKIEIDRDSLLGTIKKVAPWVIGGGLAIAGGIILYRTGYIKGILSGGEETIKITADHLGESLNHVCVCKNSNGIPVVFRGIALASENDIPIAAKILTAESPDAGNETVLNKLAKSLSNIMQHPGSV